jgi:hypothetical protein
MASGGADREGQCLSGQRRDGGAQAWRGWRSTSTASPRSFAGDLGQNDERRREVLKGLRAQEVGEGLSESVKTTRNRRSLK